MRIRLCTPNDVSALYQLFYDTVHTINAHHYNQEQLALWAPQVINIQEWAARFETNTCYVVELYATIIAFGDITVDGEIDRLFVHKDHQKKGAGFLILQHLIDYAYEAGLNSVSAQVSITAKPFFERCGFCVTKKQETDSHGVVFERYHMEKVLE